MPESPWGHLLRWEQHNDNDEYANLADLDELEDEDDSAEEADSDALGGQDQEQDIAETEQPCQPMTRCKLSEDAIVEIINERIAHYTNLWVPNKGVPKEEQIIYDLERMWEDAEASGQREQLVARHRAELEFFTQGLDMLCTEIVTNPGNNADIIRRQCNNLEVTIDNMELSRWLVSIYELSPESGSDEIEDVHGPINLGSPSPSPRSGEEEEDANIMGTVKMDPTATADGIHLRLGISGSLFDYEDEPEHASIMTVRRWKWEDLVETQDRKRVITKAIYELPTAARENIHSRLKLVGKMTVGKEVKAYIDMILRGESRIQGVLPRDLLKIGIFSNLFVSWWLSDNCFLKTPPRERFEEIRDEGLADFEVFFDFLSTVMSTTFSKEALQHPDRPSEAEIIEISDDDDEDMTAVTTQVQGKTGSIMMPPGLQQVGAIILD